MKLIDYVLGSPVRRLVRIAAVAALAVGGIAAEPNIAEAQNKFVFANSSAYDSLDPHAIFDVGRVASRINLYDGLLRWEDNPPQLEPWLAESYEVSDDGLTYTFSLRSESKFNSCTAPVRSLMMMARSFSAERPGPENRRSLGSIWRTVAPS